jgi:putative transposase
LDENWFESLEQARQIIATWSTDYNEIRPHSGCGRMPSATFAALNRQLTGDSKPKSKTDIQRSVNLASCKLPTFGI